MWYNCCKQGQGSYQFDSQLPIILGYFRHFSKDFTEILTVTFNFSINSAREPSKVSQKVVFESCVWVSAKSPPEISFENPT